MHGADCENLFTTVQELCPTCRMTIAGFKAIWKRRLNRWDYTEVLEALDWDRGDAPDATKPSWDAVIDRLTRRHTLAEESYPSDADLDAERAQTGRFLDAMTDAELEALRVEALKGMTRVTGITVSPTRTWLMEADLRTHDVLRSYLGGYLREQGRL